MSAETPPFIVVEHGSRRIAIPRNEDYNETVEFMRRSFWQLEMIPPNCIVLTTMVPESNLGPFEVGWEVWRGAMPYITILKIDVVASMPTTDSRQSVLGCTDHTPIRLDPLPRPELMEIVAPHKAQHESIHVSDIQPRTSMTGINTLPFFAAEYNGRRVGIRRSADYDETIKSVRDAFPALAEISKSRISLAQVFVELGEGAVEVNRELWKDVLPLVKTMQVVVTNANVPVKPLVAPFKRRKTQDVDTVPEMSDLRITAPDTKSDMPKPRKISRIVSESSRARENEAE
ncbi:unnamed protein product [Rhizoctonia solani]|uniref:Uncharacterized protein n=2 Tax=Rhizoctonia solani TaxID=456999 RepID=A0A8H3HEU7_9AGAM